MPPAAGTVGQTAGLWALAGVQAAPLAIHLSADGLGSSGGQSMHPQSLCSHEGDPGEAPAASCSHSPARRQGHWGYTSTHKICLSCWDSLKSITLPNNPGAMHPPPWTLSLAHTERWDLEFMTKAQGTGHLGSFYLLERGFS